MHKHKKKLTNFFGLCAIKIKFQKNKTSTKQNKLNKKSTKTLITTFSKVFFHPIKKTSFPIIIF